ncbi:uncharacterized protein GLRG_11356 [Colletotrichum graminicola M1.001]|uniref:Uncharacterized protein n=1 Tax=Colletotrichum graminicola (strain M1.001 / M2 / FGSC 10212) TaxID=645133 RepID=E3QZC3_COLGM|nr:uncharacterized protein GLRG_11356 [Colletotrichum graminicola M1.001]EFQ36211.1 hypothetical protein GLRG_11356 [Colletotrichum graminicola M1.001]
MRVVTNKAPSDTGDPGVGSGSLEGLINGTLWARITYKHLLGGSAACAATGVGYKL